MRVLPSPLICPLSGRIQKKPPSYIRQSAGCCFFRIPLCLLAATSPPKGRYKCVSTVQINVFLPVRPPRKNRFTPPAVPVKSETFTLFNNRKRRTANFMTVRLFVIRFPAYDERLPDGILITGQWKVLMKRADFSAIIWHL